MVQLGKLLVLLGAVIFIIGLVLIFSPKIPYLGKLPGDIHIKKDNFELYIPLATSLLISVALSGILWFHQLFWKKMKFQLQIENHKSLNRKSLNRSI